MFNISIRKLSLNIVLHVTILFTILALIFMFYICKITTHHINDEISRQIISGLDNILYSSPGVPINPVLSILNLNNYNNISKMISTELQNVINYHIINDPKIKELIANNNELKNNLSNIVDSKIQILIKLNINNSISNLIINNLDNMLVSTPGEPIKPTLIFNDIEKNDISKKINIKIQTAINNIIINDPKIKDLIDSNNKLSKELNDTKPVKTTEPTDDEITKQDNIKSKIDENNYKITTQITNIINNFNYDYYINGPTQADIYTTSINNNNTEIINQIINILENFNYEYYINIFNKPEPYRTTVNTNLFNNIKIINILLVIFLVFYVSMLLITNTLEFKDVRNIFIENILTFLFVGVVEVLFFLYVATKFVPAPPSILISSLLNLLKKYLEDRIIIKEE
jgi:hypothetical protein